MDTFDVEIWDQVTVGLEHTYTQGSIISPDTFSTWNLVHAALCPLTVGLYSTPTPLRKDKNESESSGPLVFLLLFIFSLYLLLRQRWCLLVRSWLDRLHLVEMPSGCVLFLLIFILPTVICNECS